jgi:hypothetical protein
MFHRNPDPNSVAKSIAAAYSILLLNVLLLAGLGFMVFFIGGLIQNMMWILLAGSAAAAGSGYLIYRRMKQQGRRIREILALPALTNRSVEISFMGGLASLKIGQSDPMMDMPYVGEKMKRLENPEAGKIHDLSELVRLLENDLITWDEYSLAKKKIFGS